MKHLDLTPALYNYLLDTSLREHPVLKKLREKTSHMMLAQMQVSPEQAQFMQLLLRIVKAKNVLELGTFTGYSALAMALALPEDGHVITCDISTEWTDHAHPFWKEAQQDKRIELRLGRANDSLKKLLEEGRAHSFDFIFIDADKTGYVGYYEYALQLISPNGLIAIDNVLWDGDVIDMENTNAQTREIRRLNAIIKEDERVDISLLAIADGLFLVRPRT